MNDPGIQSTVHAAPGSGAALIHELSLALYAGSALIFVGVMILLLRAVFSGPQAINARRWIVGGGILFPALVLSVLLVYSLAIGNTLSNIGAQGPLRFVLDCISSGARALAAPAQPADTMRIEIVARQWWWEVRYRAAGENSGAVVLANELHLPSYRPIEILLHSDDVIHSFWVPALAGKVDMIPGRRNRIVVQTNKSGIYRGQCAEYCGGQHALMAFYVVVQSEKDFQAWLAQQALPARPPDDPFLKSGHDAFMEGGCGGCHTVRGTEATGRSGPDLTHVGSRHSLAAGVLDNHIGTMAGWIAGAQDIKKGNLMPSMNIYAGRDLRAVSAWLDSLK